MPRSFVFRRVFSRSNPRRGTLRSAPGTLAAPLRGLRRAELESLETRNMLAILTVNGAGGADYTTIGAAIAAAHDHDVVQVAAGTYNEQLTIGSSLTSLTIEGAGSGNSASDTIIDAGGGVGIDIQASGASAADRLVIEGLRVQDASNAVYFNAAVSHVTLDNVATVNSSNGIEIHNSAIVGDLLLNNVQSTGNSNGFRVATSGSVDGLTIQGGAFDNNTIGFYTNATSGSTTNQNDFTNVSITGTSFSNDSLKGIYVEKLDHATLDGIVVANSGTSGANSAGIDINLKYGAYQSITIQNSSITGSGTGDTTSGVGVTVKARSDSPSYNSNPATLDGVLISHNIVSGNQRALRIGEAGGLAGPTNVKINYNDLSASVSGVALDNEASPAIDASKNWWGDISGPTAAANSGGLGQSITGPRAANVTIGPWLIYGTDSDSATAGFQLPSLITVSAGGDVSAADNDFIRLHNAIGAVADGQTVQLSGTFDWTSPFAAAAYAASNSDSSSHDIRGVLLPSGVNNVTITNSGGTAMVKGGGDFNDGIYSAFIFAADGASAQGNNNLTIENLNLNHFEAGIMLGWNSTGQFNGTHVQNNTITVAGDNGGVQNIAVYFWHGTNQQMTGNTIDFEADGTNSGPSGPRSFGFQDGTTGGTGYDGLTISGNTFQLINVNLAQKEVLTGIWENGHNDDNNSHISITNNRFLGQEVVTLGPPNVPGGRVIDYFDRALMLTSQTSNMLVDGNTFTDVHYVFFARNASGGTDPGDQFTFTNNVLTRVGGADGVFLQNVTNDPTPVHVLIHWNINNTIDGETGVRGLNELSVQATHASRPTSGASDLDAVDAVSAKPVVFVNPSWNGASRFTDPDGISAGIGPVAYGFNGFSTIQQGIDNVDVGGTVNVGAGAYAEEVSIGKDLTLAGQGNITLSAPTAGSGTGVNITGNPNAVTLSGLTIENFDTGIGTSGVGTLNLNDVVLSGNTLGGLISGAGALNVTSTSDQDQTVSVTAGGQDALQFTGQDAIDFSGVNNLLIATGSGSDTFNVVPLTGTTVSVDGGDPTPPTTPGDKLLVDLSGTTSPALSVTNSAAGSSGSWSFAGQQPVNFSHIESLQSTADLEVTNSAPGAIAEGGSLTYTITIHNNSALPIDNVVLTDVLPSGVTFDSGSFDQGTVTNSSGTVTVDVGTIAAGATVNGTITVTAIEEGSVANTISVSSSSPNAIPDVTANTTVTDPAVSASGGYTVNAIKGFLSSEQQVAMFVDPGGVENPTYYTADIDWGDGSPVSQGKILSGYAAFQLYVTGQHTYATAGTYTITVTIHHRAAPDATVMSTAQVANPTVQAQGGSTINAVENVDTGTQDVATFTDPGGAGPLGDYSADIAWGDGSTTAGTITYDAGSDTFAVHGGHSYAEDGTKTIQVTIHRVAVPDTVVSSTAIVAEPAITPTAVAVNGNEFSQLSNVAVATFTHGNNTEPASDFTATIHWGDGTSSTGTVTLSGGIYTVSGSHMYADEGQFSISVSIEDDTASASVQTTATMLEELLPDGTRGTADQRFISELYRELLGRPIDASGLAHWSAMLAGGASRSEIAAGIEASQEYREVLVKGLYQRYLHRDAEADALSHWTQFLANGHTPEDLSAQIVGSDEYFNVRGGGTEQGFIDALFHDALGRAADPQGETAFQQVLTGGKWHLAAADIVFGSAEYRDDLVQSYYQNYLGRPAESDGQDYWAGQLADRSDEEVIASIVSQDEFYAKTSA